MKLCAYLFSLFLFCITIFSIEAKADPINKLVALGRITSNDICQYGGCPSFSYNSCSVAVKPDLAVIVGGIVVEGMKPTEAKQKLENTVKKIQEYISEKNKNAKVERKGTVRLATNMFGVNKVANFANYSVAEKLEILLPTESDIDSVLEKLPELGMNRLGTSWSLGYNDNTPKPVVLYKVSKLSEKLDNLIEECKEAGWKQYCQSNAYGVQQKFCGMNYSEIKNNIKPTYLYVAGPMAMVNNNMQNFYLNYPWNQDSLDEAKFTENAESRLVSTSSTFMLLPAMDANE